MAKAKPAPNSHKKYTPADVSKIKKGANEEIGVKKIAKELGRTEEAIIEKAQKEGISLKDNENKNQK